MKAILWGSVVGLMVLLGCTRNVVHEQGDASLPVIKDDPIDLNAAVAKAKSENKTVLLDFTGSDWCPPCKELQKEIFSQPTFQSYAESNLIFLVVDFPTKAQLPPAASATNDLLAQQFKIEGFPTLVAVNGHGETIWQHEGFLEGGPKALQDELEAARKK